MANQDDYCDVCDDCLACCECECSGCGNAVADCSCEDEIDFDEEYEREHGSIAFARPGSALRAASRDNPRNLPCPTCGAEDVLTPADVRQGYQCDACADRAEGKGY